MNSNKPSAKISKARLVRAVASSSAIETGKSIKSIEVKLKTKGGKYHNLQLGS